MKLEIEPSLTSDTARYVVTLSSRNLKTLLLKLLEPSSKRTIFVPTRYGVLYVVAESDKEHYGVRATPPGVMHPREEASLQRGADLADNGSGQTPDLFSAGFDLAAFSAASDNSTTATTMQSTGDETV